MMADATYQLTGTPGVLVATLGPGITNTATAVAQAYLDRSAVAVLTLTIEGNRPKDNFYLYLNYLAFVLTSDASGARGLYKTTDGGATWNILEK